MSKHVPLGLLFWLCGLSRIGVGAAEIVLPDQRTSYYASEAVEVAVSGLAKGTSASVALVPQEHDASPVKFQVTGDGSTASTMIPAGALAPGAHAVHLDGKDTRVRIIIASGIGDSTMLVSQTARLEELEAGEGNFILGNAFGFGALGHDGLPRREPRVRTNLLNTYDRAVAMNLPTLVYMYWTGYVTHKPWGTRKSWSADPVQETMRLFSLHQGQRLRRFRANIGAVGTIDEPGLNWGRTPAGGRASGFPCWDQRGWYERRGWTFTDDPASRPDADWMRYMTIRCGIIGESQAQAKRDLAVAWPSVPFETDIYAVSVVCDGADAMNQEVNGDTPTTHVFLGWGVGRDCAVTEIAIEKASNPTANVAHAMNGQLQGGRVPQPQHRICYRLMMNSMLAAGLKSNWWLNWGGMTAADLAAVNEPAKRYGPLLAEMKSTGHDVAVLWGFTELCMREKAVVAHLARQKDGKPLKLTISALPENTAVKNKEIEVTPYTVGYNYRNQISHIHNALLRAGYPAHVVHERILPRGVLRNYKTLVVVGQTFPFPPETQKAIADFVARGGQVVVDGTTTVQIDGAVVTEADVKDIGLKWGALYAEATKKDHSFESDREASYFTTNLFMNQPIYKAVAPMKAAMAKTNSKPVAATGSTDLIFQRHVAGEGAVVMVLNTHQKLPQTAEDKPYLVWNYAPYKATFALRGVKPGSVVYAVEGIDWKKVSKVADPSKPIQADFAAGEMKLYLVAPRRPQGIQATAEAVGSTLKVSATLVGPKMPWPVTIRVTDPGGKPLYEVHRSLDAEGRYAEAFPVGANAPAGEYVVRAASPVGNVASVAKAGYRPSAKPPAASGDRVRVFDETAIRTFLATKPTIVIAIGSDKHKATADRLAQALNAKGINASVVPEQAIIERVRYPRVWDPYFKVYRNQGAATKPEGPVDLEVKLEIRDDGRIVATTQDGKDLGYQWRHRRKTLATVVGKGYIDYHAADGEEGFEPGCRLYINEKGQRVVLKGERTEVKATADVRQKWSRPWHRLGSFQGAWNLTPQLPEAYRADTHMVLLGDSASGELVRALQASELLRQIVDAKYPGPGKSLVSFAWSPFALGKNVIFIGASDGPGLEACIAKLAALLTRM